jgi:hypothetical protein
MRVPRILLGDLGKLRTPQQPMTRRLAALAAMELLAACGSPASAPPPTPATPTPTPTPTLGGLTTGDLKATFERAFDVTCGSVQPGKNTNHIDCQASPPPPALTITIDTPKNSGLVVTQIRATTDLGRSTAGEIFDALANLPYYGSRPDEARAWVRLHLDEATSQRFGPALFAVSHTGQPAHIYTLVIQAV